MRETVKKSAVLREELQQAVDAYLEGWLDMKSHGGINIFEIEESLFLLVAQMRLIEMRLRGIELSLDAMRPEQ